MTANQLTVRVPKGSVVCGVLLDHYAPEDLDQDIFQVRLPNGVVVDVGWDDDGSPSGEFVIVVFKDHYLNQLAPVKSLKTPRQVAWEVANLAERFSAPEVASGFSKSIVIGKTVAGVSSYASSKRELARA